MPYVFNPFTNNLDATASVIVPPGTVASLTGNDAIAVGPDGGGNINVVGDGVTIDVAGNAGTNTLTISAISPTAFLWQTVSADSTMAPNNGYIVITDTNVNLLLPVASNVGDIIKISAPYAYTGSFTITQPDNVEVELGDVASTFGTAGSIAATEPGSFITLVCTINQGLSGILWSTESSVGNFNIN